MSKKNDNKLEYEQIQDNTKIIPVEINNEVKKSFMAYAMAVNVSRAIPDVRDGLKPVHRRILYDMGAMLGVYSDKPHVKCARIVGDVLGKFHPHGDSSVYMALVRMAQDFSIRCPLVDGHGNFGSIDGDSPAAYRYTEARLSKIASEMLRDIDKETVDFIPNFDDTEKQPVVLPSRFPNLLVNGSDGIAVGMATNIPPHNINEVIDAVIAQIDNPNIEIDEIMNYLPAPDFPTGGIIMGTAGLKLAYRTGRGAVIIRAKTEIEECKRKLKLEKLHILPYQPRYTMPAILAYSDIQFIFMSQEMEMQGFPSKVYTIMACGRPLLVASGNGTPIVNFLTPFHSSKLITDYDIEEKTDKMVQWLSRVSKEELRNMGYAGEKIIKEHYSKEIVTKQYVDLIDSIL